MRRNPGTQLQKMYDVLDGYFGNLHWWPGESPLEVIVGAILTQNTNWTNVEKAIQNLKAHKLLSVRALVNVPEAELAERIRPSGYYNIKARRLKHFLVYLWTVHRGNLDRLFRGDTWEIRRGLLAIHGIGEETADSILLYAAGRPIFVVDAYTKRILLRHGLIGANADYREVQALFMDNIPSSVPIFNQYHALIVETGKRFCRKKPLCLACPLKKAGFRFVQECFT